MSRNKTQNKRAFTLTELLIVVIVIGVLSAVTLPKFNRVIENRKVTEAEEMMSAVRMEQERRCTLDQNYTTNFSNLSDVIASANTKNYTYSLQSQGISAKSASGDYTLKILSYEDGSYCCTGTGCKKLNKNYPDCATLSFPTSNCAGTEGGEPGEPEEPVAPECTNGQVKGSQVCNGCGTQTTQKCVNGKWTNVLGTCSKTAEECAPKPQCPTKPADAVKKCECGTVTASHKCDASTNYTWVQEAFPACPTKPADVTETGSDGKTVRKKTFTCVNNVWTAGNWDKECPEETCTEGSTRQSETSCGSGCGVVLEACIKGKWQGVNCVPKSGAECTPSISNQEKCPDGTYRRRTCNTATCKWGAWDKECSAQDCSNAAYKASHKSECCPSAPSTDSTCWTCGKPTFEWVSTSNRGTRVTSLNFSANSSPQACRNKTLSSCPSSVSSGNQICRNASAGANCDGYQGTYCPKSLSYSYTQGGNGNWISHLPGISPAEVIPSCSGTCCACISYVSNGVICQEKKATCVKNGW